jgi:hypothetical protein
MALSRRTTTKAAPPGHLIPAQLTRTGRQLTHVLECGFLDAKNGCRERIEKYKPDQVREACHNWIDDGVELENLRGRPAFRYCQAVINHCHHWETGEWLWPPPNARRARR